jgi:hypothetical protein
MRSFFCCGSEQSEGLLMIPETRVKRLISGFVIFYMR